MPSSPGSRAAGRPKAPVLSRRRIIETALELLDREGADGAKMRDVAHALGVRPSSLYNHVSGREDMIAGIRELISDRIDVTSFESLPWDVALARWADSYRSAFAAHPPTIALLAIMPLSAESRTSRMYDAVARALCEAGWPESRVLSVIVAFESFLLGSALDAIADPAMLDPGARADVPYASRAYAARAAVLETESQSPADAAYRLGRDALIRGLQDEFARCAPPTGSEPID